MLSALGELQEATESPGLDAVTKVAQKVEQVFAAFQLPKTTCQDFPEWAGVDDAAHGLYPADAPRGLLPLNCDGEGNLLFDAISLLLVGNTGLSLELQVSRILCANGLNLLLRFKKVTPGFGGRENIFKNYSHFYTQPHVLI